MQQSLSLTCTDAPFGVFQVRAALCSRSSPRAPQRRGYSPDSPPGKAEVISGDETKPLRIVGTLSDCRGAGALCSGRLCHARLPRAEGHSFGSMQRMGARRGPDPVHRWSALNERQRALLERVAAGEEPGAWSPGDWRSAYALRDRGLLAVGRAGGHGRAEVTEAGRFYVRLGHHPEDPAFEGGGAQEVSAGPPASTRADGRREDARRKRSPTPYSERPIARARRAKAQELVQRLVAEGRVLPHLCGGGPRGGAGSAVELLAARPFASRWSRFMTRGGCQAGVVSGAVGAISARGIQKFRLRASGWKLYLAEGSYPDSRSRKPAGDASVVPVPARLTSPHPIVAALRDMEERLVMPRPVIR
jgi:hypothetical protein